MDRGQSALWLQAPTWLVDVARLRDSLDQIRRALGGPQAVMLGGMRSTLLLERKQVAESLQAVLGVLERTDLRAHDAVASLESKFRPQSQAAAFEELLRDLQEGWRKRVLTRLGDRRAYVLSELLAQPAPDLLGLLGRAHDENAHSDVIRWLLDPRQAKMIAPRALSSLVATLDDSDSWKRLIASAAEQDLLSIQREFVIGREWSDAETLDRIDLVISGPGFVLAIENKLWSPEHQDQTQGYWRWLERLPLLRGGILLSPSGMSPLCPNFKALSYLDLLAGLLEAPATGAIGGEEGAVLAAYARTLATHVLRAELRPVRELEKTYERTQ